jgi:hypothetical protein
VHDDVEEVGRFWRASRELASERMESEEGPEGGGAQHCLLLEKVPVEEVSGKIGKVGNLCGKTVLEELVLLRVETGLREVVGRHVVLDGFGEAGVGVRDPGRVVVG